MAKTKISEFSSTPANNTDIDSINIAEGCAPSGINDAIRELMAQLKDFQTGAAGDSFNGPVGTSTAAAGAFTTLSASSTVSGTGFSNYLASPPAIGGTAAAAVSATTLTTSSTVTHNGGTANGVAYLNGSKVLTTGSALTFDGTNLGVGTAPVSGYKAAINGDIWQGNTGGVIIGSLINNAGWYELGGSANVNGLQFAHAATQRWMLNSSEQMRLTSTGLGIGTSSPVAKVQGTRDGAPASSGSLVAPVLASAGDGSQGIAFGASTGDYTWIQSAFTNNAAASAASLRFYMGATERARIDSSGNLLVGTATTGSSNLSGATSMVDTFGAYQDIGHNNTATSGLPYARFRYSGTLIGSITQNGTTAIAYNTSSDYRLKNTIAPMTGALAKVALLKPCTYKWNADDSDGEGFIAHELAEVVPQCVAGEKDAVDAEGKPVYQGIDTSFLVATLTAALQELKAIVDSQADRIAVLEAK